MSLANTSPPASISIVAPATLTAVTTVDACAVDGKLVQADEVDVGYSPSQPLSVPADCQQVDRALQDIGSNLPQAPASAPHLPPFPASSSADYDFSAPFVPLEEGVHARPRWDVHPALSHIRLMEEDDGATEAGQEREKDSQGGVPASQQADAALQAGRNTPETLPQPSAAAETHGATTAVPQPQEVSVLSGTTVTEDLQATDSRGRTRGTGETQQAVSSSSAVPELAAEPKALAGEATSAPTHGHPSDSHIHGGQNISGGMDTRTSPSCHGHASDAHIRVGENVSEVQSSLPTQNIHGHASDAHIRVGENVSEVMAALPSPSVHGHASDAHIKVGQNVSDIDSSLPAPNIHGHASDAHIRVGENVSEVATALPSPSVHGHASDAHIKVGENVSEVVAPLPSQNVHGHASDANLKVGGFVSEVTPSRPRWSKHGHASDSTLGVGCLVAGVEPALSPLPGSAYGHSSDSTLGIGCMVGGAGVTQSPLPRYGISLQFYLAWLITVHRVLKWGMSCCWGRATVITEAILKHS